jgi:hypothetical protein
MLETHIMMCLLNFCLTFLPVLHLVFLMDLTIAHMVLLHKRVVLCLDTLVWTHALIVVFVSRVGMVFPLEVSILTLSRVTLMVPAFPSRPTRSNGEVQRIVKTSLGRMVKCWIPKIFLTNPSIEPSTFSHSM